MPFQPINFAGIAPQGNPAMRNLADTLLNSISAGMKISQMPSQFERQAQTENLQNSLKQMDIDKMKVLMPYLGQGEKANIDLTNAQSNRMNQMTPQDVIKEKLFNQFYPDYVKSQINLNNMGGSRGGVGTKEQMFYESNVGKDNPQLQTPDQIREAANVLASGGNSLSDGTKLNSLSPSSRASLDRITKMGTTSPILTGRSQTEGREAELPIINSYISDSIKPYGDTYFGISPSLEKDKISNDPVAQKRVGQFLAGQQLNFERANIANALAQGQGGEKIVNQMIDEGKQKIKSSDFKLSEPARQEAIRYYTEAIQKATKARMSNPVGASYLSAPPKDDVNIPPPFMSNPGSNPGSSSGGSTEMYFNGKWKSVPNDQVEYWRGKGAKPR